MNIKIEAKELIEFKKVSRAKEVQINANGKKIEIYSNVDDIEILKSIDGVINETGTCTINIGILDLLKAGEITITEKGLENSGLQIELLESLEPIEYPPFIENEILVSEIKKDELKEMLEVSYAIAKDNYRPILNNIYLKGNEAVTLDGYRLAKRNTKFGLQEQILIPHEAVKILKRIKEDASISKDGSNNIIFKVGSYTIRFENSKETYIRYWDLIPKDNHIECIIEADTLLGSLRRINKVNRGSYDSNLVRLEFKKDKLNVLMKRFDLKIKETLECKCSEEIDVGFNSRYLADALRGVKGEIKITLKSPVSPAILIKENKEDLVLPIRIEQRKERDKYE